LRSISRPKFKITEHPDGYSIQFGMAGYYMRGRYTTSDNSIDFNIMDHKGSIKYVINEWRPDGPDFEGTFEVAGPKDGRDQQRGRLPPIDAKIKLKHARTKTGKYNSPLDPHDIVLTFVNNYRHGREWISMPSMEMRDPKQVEAVLRMTMNPRNWVDSTMSFAVNARGDIYDENSGSYESYEEKWRPGTYNLSASMQIIKFEEPSPSQRQPKMSAGLELEEDVTFDDSQDNPELPRSQKLFRKNILIDGMINLTGKGARLGVIKFTDAETDKSIARIQARRADEENLRLEIFADGREKGALNYFQNAAGMTNITVEDTQCSRFSDDPDYSYGSFNGTEFGNYTDTENGTQAQGCKNIRRMLESVSDDGLYESRIYADAFHMRSYYDPEDLDAVAGEKGLLFEEKMSKKGDKYEGSMMFGSRYQQNKMSCVLNNEGEDTHVQMGVSDKYRKWNGDEYKLAESHTMDMIISPSKNEDDEFNFKLLYKEERIFDGFFYLARIIRRFVREVIPAKIENSLSSFQESHAETVNYLSNVV